jgi:hypothetical protein
VTSLKPHVDGNSLTVDLNTRWHRRALAAFMVIVIAHWAEHLVQAFQIYVLGWPIPKSLGALGFFFPWLVSSETMHYGYAVVMLIGLFWLRKAFTGRARFWWNMSLGIQVWHHFEHLLLLIQAITGSYLLDKPTPVSVIQLLVPRVELHLFYNAIVFAPMVVATILHMRPILDKAAETPFCTCAKPVSASA